ncbi:MAG: hypothetical protein JW940_23975 [Polyangiaceae bacterium]|nr:hypothetical protein [Polyangiaceae bacterium]
MTDRGLEFRRTETWLCATDSLIFKASSPEEMLGLLLARVEGAMDSDLAAAAEMLRHLLAMTRGLVQLYGLRARPSLTQPS